MGESQSVWYASGDGLAEAQLLTARGLLGDAFDGVGKLTVETPPYLGAVTADDQWRNFPVPAQAGAFVASFDTIPSAAAVNTVVGFSAEAADFWEDLAVYVRFGPTGIVDARDGSGFAAESVLNYQPGASYHVRMDVNLATKTYSATVTPSGGMPVVIARNYDFRTEQANVTQLSNLACLTLTGGTQQVAHVDVQTLTVTTATNVWNNLPVPSQGGVFRASFRTTPGGSAVDTVIGFSTSAADFWNDLSAYVRFGPSGVVDARDYDGFAAANPLSYSPGISYFVQMEINVPSKTYRATVTPEGGTPVLIADNFSFRDDLYASTVNLANFSCLTWTGGTQSVSGLTVSGDRLGLPALTAPGVGGPLVTQAEGSQIEVTKEIRLVPGIHATDDIIVIRNLAPSPTRVTLRVDDNYGSDGATVVHQTSSGDLFVTETDEWFVSNDQVNAEASQQRSDSDGLLACVFQSWGHCDHHNPLSRTVLAMGSGFTIRRNCRRGESTGAHHPAPTVRIRVRSDHRRRSHRKRRVRPGRPARERGRIIARILPNGHQLRLRCPDRAGIHHNHTHSDADGIDGVGERRAAGLRSGKPPGYPRIRS